MRTPFIEERKESDDLQPPTKTAPPNEIKNKRFYQLQITLLTIGMLALGFLTAGPTILGMKELLPQVVSALNWFIGSVLHLPALAVIPPVPVIAITVTVSVIVACLTLLWAYLYGEPILQEMTNGARNKPHIAKREEKAYTRFFQTRRARFEAWRKHKRLRQAIFAQSEVLQQAPTPEEEGSTPESEDIENQTLSRQVAQWAESPSELNIAQQIGIEWLKIKAEKAESSHTHGGKKTEKQAKKVEQYGELLEQALHQNGEGGNAFSYPRKLIEQWIISQNPSVEQTATIMHDLTGSLSWRQRVLLRFGVPLSWLLSKEQAGAYERIVRAQERRQAFHTLCQDPIMISKKRQRHAQDTSTEQKLTHFAEGAVAEYWKLADTWARQLLPPDEDSLVDDMEERENIKHIIYKQLMGNLADTLYKKTPEFSPETKWVKKVINGLGWVLNPAINALGLIVGVYGLFLLIPMPAAVQIPIIALAGLLGFLAAAFRTRKSAVGLYGGFFEQRRKARMQKGTFLENKQSPSLTTKALLIGALAFSMAITVFNWSATGMAILGMQNFAYYLANPGALTPALVHNFAALSPLVQAGCIVGGLSTFIFVLTFMADGVVNRTEKPWNKVVLPISIIATAGNSIFLAYNVYMTSGSLFAGGVIFIVALFLTMNLFKLASDSIQDKCAPPHPLFSTSVAPFLKPAETPSMPAPTYRSGLQATPPSSSSHDASIDDALLVKA